MDTKAIFDAVKSIVHPVYLVGGSVRDLQLNKQPKDYDFCTPLSPDDVEQMVKSAGKRVYGIGKRFGTVGFTVEGNFIEVTTFRQEEYQPNNRRPTVVFIKDLKEDLARRDFTFNAMAVTYVDDTVQLIDPYGGQSDLEAGIIRAVGKPVDRIREDPLRMLRAARFAAQLDYDLDQTLSDAISSKAHYILTISRERWAAEMDKLLVSNNPIKGLQVLADTGLLKYMLPELAMQVGYDQNNPHHSMDLWGHTTTAVSLIDNDIDMRWAALLHDIGKPFARTENPKGHSNYIMHEKISAELVIGIAERLKWSTARREKVHELVLNHMQDDSPLRSADNGAKQYQRRACSGQPSQQAYA